MGLVWGKLIFLEINKYLMLFFFCLILVNWFFLLVLDNWIYFKIILVVKDDFKFFIYVRGWG